MDFCRERNDKIASPSCGNKLLSLERKNNTQPRALPVSPSPQLTHFICRCQFVLTHANLCNNLQMREAWIVWLKRIHDAEAQAEIMYSRMEHAKAIQRACWGMYSNKYRLLFTQDEPSLKYLICNVSSNEVYGEDVASKGGIA